MPSERKSKMPRSRIIDYSSQHRVGSRFTASSNLRRNPEAKFGEQPGTKRERFNLFAQYKTNPSYTWVRETIQNAVDNKATQVDITMIDIPDGPLKDHRIVRIKDNGSGMSLKILQDKFLTIGGTGKGEREEETGSIGGFGEAKKVILLAWKAWRVITKTKHDDKAVVADSPFGWKDYNYDYVPVPQFTKPFESGTVVEVVCWPEKKIFMSDAMNFVSCCDLPDVNFTFATLNDTGTTLFAKSDLSYNYYLESAIDQTTHWYDNHTATDLLGNVIKLKREECKTGIGRFQLGRAVETFSATVEQMRGGSVVLEERECAKLYFRKFPKGNRDLKSRIFYRVKGLFLWSEYLSDKVHGNIIVDFTIKTTAILSDNRDSIRNDELRTKINAWITELTEDPRSKIRGYTKQQTIIYRGTGKSLRAPTRPTALATAKEIADLQYRGLTKNAEIKAIDEVAERAAKTIVEMEQREKSESPIKISADIAKKLISYEAKATLKDGSKVELVDAISRAMFVPEYVLHIEDDLAEEGFTVPEKFKPEKLTIELKKIIAVWAEMTRLIFMMKGSNQDYAVGFVFSEETDGIHMPSGFAEKHGSQMEADGAVLINPYCFDRFKRSLTIDVTDSNHLEKMWAICVHECTHMIDMVQQHDEAYASMLTENVGIVARVYPLVEAIVDVVKTSDPLARDRFAKDLDVEEYLMRDKRKGAKIRSAREKKLERYASEIATRLAEVGIRVPDQKQYDVDISGEVWDPVTAAQSGHKEKTQFSDYTSKLLIQKLRKELEEAKKKTTEVAIQEVSPKPPKPTTPLFKKYN